MSAACYLLRDPAQGMPHTKHLCKELHAQPSAPSLKRSAGLACHAFTGRPHVRATVTQDPLPCSACMFEEMNARQTCNVLHACCKANLKAYLAQRGKLGRLTPACCLPLLEPRHRFRCSGYFGARPWPPLLHVPGMGNLSKTSASRTLASFIKSVSTSPPSNLASESLGKFLGLLL